MFAALLASPKLVIGIGIALIITFCGLYFFYTRNEIKNLNNKIEIESIQVKQDIITIKDLNDRLVLVQQLNNNFNNAINKIQTKEDLTIKALSSFNIKLQSIKNPRAVEVFINKRTNQIFQDLNNLTKTDSVVSK